MPFTPQHPRLMASVTMIGALALVSTTFAGTAWAGGHDGPTSRSADRSASSVRDHDGDADHDPSTRVTESDDASDTNGPSRHPSGNDRSVEPGGSRNQGRAESDPDGMYNGGVDKPGGRGGVYTGDQDGNNGCGNDNDFEDDNRGNCGGRAHERGRRNETPPRAGSDDHATPTPPATVTPHVEGNTAGAGAVADTCPTPGITVSMLAGCELAVTAPAAAVLGASQPAAGEVLAAEAVAAEAGAAPVNARSAGAATLAATSAGNGSALAFTGLNALSLLLLALVAIAIGWVLVRSERRRNA